MWHMGGYAFYVWTAYGVVVFGLGWMMIKSIRDGRKISAFLKKQFEMAKLELS